MQTRLSPGLQTAATSCILRVSTHLCLLMRDTRAMAARGTPSWPPGLGRPHVLTAPTEPRAVQLCHPWRLWCQPPETAFTAETGLVGSALLRQNPYISVDGMENTGLAFYQPLAPGEVPGQGCKTQCLANPSLSQVPGESGRLCCPLLGLEAVLVSPAALCLGPRLSGVNPLTMLKDQVAGRVRAHTSLCCFTLQVVTTRTGGFLQASLRVKGLRYPSSLCCSPRCICRELRVKWNS